MNEKTVTKVGIVGTGFIARGLAHLIRNSQNLSLTGMLTRRNDPKLNLPIPENRVYRNPDKFLEQAEIVVVTTGDPIYSTEVIVKAFEYGLPVVTMDAETQITSGSWLCKKGLITEAEGDQPGSLAALNREIIDMGFTPLVYGNIKGFLNHNPTHEDMVYWAGINGISLTQVTSFTDGTKIQIEQCLVANGLGADIFKQGLLGEHSADLNIGAMTLAKRAENFGAPLSDYILDRTAPPGVFIVATHQSAQLPYLKYLKMGSEGKYILAKPYHLCHLEIPKTLKQVIKYKEILLNNSSEPTISVGAIAKRRIKPGEFIKKAIGSFDMRGEALKIAENPEHIPIGLISDARILRNIEPGQLVTFDDLEVSESTALKAWMETKDQVILQNQYDKKAQALLG